MTLRAQRVAVTSLMNVDLQREVVARAVRDVAIGAGDGAGLEATAQRERLRAIEAVGPAVGPELALQIAGRNRLADQKRQRVVGKAIAAFEAGKHVGLVAVAVRAGVVDAPRLRAARRENLQDVAQLPVLRAVVV